MKHSVWILKKNIHPDVAYSRDGCIFVFLLWHHGIKRINSKINKNQILSVVITPHREANDAGSKGMCGKAIF